MLKRNKWLVLPAIIILYAAFHIATSHPYPCDSECERFGTFQTAVTTDRPFVRGVFTDTAMGKTFRIFVDTFSAPGRNWHTFSDTVCRLATSSGYSQPYVIIVADAPGAASEIANQHCP